MNSPAMFLVSTVIWSFAISLAALLGLMVLDWLELRRTRKHSAEPGLRVDSAQMLKRLQQPLPPRRRQSKPVAVKAA